ncbi:MAG: hypothetical protein JRN06_03385 [Nitrososphaerota archaeon]|nr:hypothetical protein [Nitrososphaerota archaeon]MDG7023098.1 hypothetical protein [Nitrososphaerota archaeon]
MPTITVRVTEEEKKKLLQHGPLSDTVRKALDRYLMESERMEFLQELKEFQAAHPVTVDPDEIVRIIREGRKH